MGAMRKIKKQKHFWLTMQYTCTNGHYAKTMYLEDGLERELPVPMFVGTCLDCGYPIGHVKWDEDYEVSITFDDLPEDAPYFVFPSKRLRKKLGSNACGVPANRPPGWFGKRK